MRVMVLLMNSWGGGGGGCEEWDEKVKRWSEVCCVEKL